MGPEIPIIKSKLSVPVNRSSLVIRTRLLEQLNNGLFQNDEQKFERRLTLISAPAGYGKSTLAVSWLADKQRAAWLSLDQEEDDPVRFWVYFVMALREQEQKIGTACMAALSSSPMALNEKDQSEISGKDALVFLLNDLFELKKPILLVLDDYHSIKDEQIHQGLAFLVENMPSTFHLVITTRSDPPMSLSRWKIRGWMKSFRQKDLRFNLSETSVYFQQNHQLELTCLDMEALVQRTEGWVSGLQIAALSLGGKKSGDKEALIKNVTGDNRYLGEYLTEEIINRQPVYVRDFLYKTSILSYLSPSLCQKLTGRDDAEDILLELENQNLFIFPLEDRGKCFRYHALFKDLLQNHLQTLYGHEVADLHNLASRWYENNGYTSLAIDHALKARDFTQAVLLLDGYAEHLFNRGEQKNLYRWIQLIPAQFKQEHPRLLIFESMTLYLSGKISEAKRVMDEVRKTLEAHELLKENMNDQEEDPAAQALIGMYFAMQAFLRLFSGEYAHMAKNASLALKLLPEEKTLWRSGVSVISGDIYALSGALATAEDAYSQALTICRRSKDHYFTLMAGFKLLRVWFYQGKFTEVSRLGKELLKEADEIGFAKTARAGSIIVLQGMIACERNQLDEALEHVKRGLSLIENENYMLLGWANACLAKVHLARKEHDEASASLRLAEKYGQAGNIPYVDNLAAAGKARLWLVWARKDPSWTEEAYQLLKKRLPEICDACQKHIAEHIQFFRLDEYQALVRVLLARNQIEQAEQILLQLEPIARQGNAAILTMEFLMLRALARLAREGDEKKNEQEALNLVNQALDAAGARAREEGWVRVFVNEGSPMARLLYLVAKANVYPDFVGSLLAKFPSELSSQSTLSDKKEDLVEPLSKRELEIMKLIADGLSNQDIAAELYLSKNTVKWHVKNIYGKLSVDNRAASIAQARSLNLID